MSAQAQTTQSCHHNRQRQTQHSCTLIQLITRTKTLRPNDDISTKLLHHKHFHPPTPHHSLPASINLVDSFGKTLSQCGAYAAQRDTT
jgi:hypothetical protein